MSDTGSETFETLVRTADLARGGADPPPSMHEITVDDQDKLLRRLRRSLGRAISDFQLIEEGDRILVAVSGGKDSWALLHLLHQARRRAPVSFELVAVNIDQGYFGFRQDRIADHCRELGVEFHMEEFDIAGIVEDKVAAFQTPCPLCARLRRGALSGYAGRYSCNKIALGHHLDDFIETLLLNSFYVGRLASMSPKFTSEKDGVQETQKTNFQAQTRSASSARCR